MDVLKLVLISSFCTLLSLRAGAYPGDLDLESVTDETPKSESKGAEKAAEKTAAADPEKVQSAKNSGSSSTSSSPSTAELAAHEAKEYENTLCHSTREYIDTLKFLRGTKVIIVTENTARMIADKVSKSCDGGSERFAKILTLLKTVGLSDLKSLEVALDFSSRPLEVQKNFIEIFNRAFLAEFFDYDYRTAASLAFELSKNYKGDAKQVREDFIELVRFCKADDKLDLPARLCAEYAIKLARLTQFHPDGVRASFHKLFGRLRDDRTFAMDIRTALEISYNILRFGPRATDNFFAAYDYAISEPGLSMSHGAAVEFSLRMASRSFKGSQPPLAPDPQAPYRFEPQPVMIRGPAGIR